MSDGEKQSKDNPSVVEVKLAPDFRRQFFADRDDLVAARWWHAEAEQAASFAAPDPGFNRRGLLIAVGGTLGVYLVSYLIRRYQQSDDEPVLTSDALDLQRRQGWNVGASDQALSYRGGTGVDAAGSAYWYRDLEVLAADLAPSQATLAPFYVPTLLQVLGEASFPRTVQPMRIPEMDEAFARGGALADLFADLPEPTATTLLIDVPGPQAVAVAAALAGRFDPVFLFDNWPHPRGVVPSQEVIAAAIYYRPVLLAARNKRPTPAPAAFVIDSRRLTHYRDDSDSFDNRYLARLPSAAALGAQGVKHLLYVTEQPVAHEADDLNDDFTALVLAGIDVKLLALSDFRAHPLSAGYSYGGSSASRLYFWHSYGWYHVPSPPAGGRPPAVLSDGARFTPTPRNTIFSSRTVGGLGGVGKQKPSGFGRVSYRASSSGQVSFGRSGSLGRARFGGGG